MNGWLIYNEADAKKNKGYIQFYKEEGEKLGIRIHLIYVEKLHFGVKNNELYLEYEIENIPLPDFIICRTIYPFLTVHLEQMGYLVYNNSKVASICNDKARTYQYLAKKGIAMVDSEFCNNQYFYQKIHSSAKQTVVKAVSGHGGSQVFLIQEPTVEEIDKVYQDMRGDNLVIQPLVGTKHQDLRVYVIGQKIIAAILRTAKDGFKSNFSLGGEVREYKLNQQEIEVVHQIIHQFEFGLVGIDFIINDQNQLIFNEIEDVVGARMLYQCTDINLVRLYLEFILQDMKKKK
ncbi:ATP-grasp domain-containing protein [Anaeromicropila herbilytica]|uniref:ATP-grasp domain-containing protein n=1 Tax=Anaeromicropila herbilytica TaxID=2785025 RepID=A0A7R7IDU6_9FIRM|nr:ATP-grasp domain-containing protein [Anaeromicropila herbilytica]BCN31444.1 hypothetical protein bsdtb5_27390 [Anaeromicropila herbilytica]